MLPPQSVQRTVVRGNLELFLKTRWSRSSWIVAIASWNYISLFGRSATKDTLAKRSFNSAKAPNHGAAGRRMALLKPGVDACGGSLHCKPHLRVRDCFRTPALCFANSAYSFSWQVVHLPASSVGLFVLTNYLNPSLHGHLKKPRRAKLIL